MKCRTNFDFKKCVLKTQKKHLFSCNSNTVYIKALKCLSICPPAISKVDINQQLSFVDALRSKAP